MNGTPRNLTRRSFLARALGALAAAPLAVAATKTPAAASSLPTFAGMDERPAENVYCLHDSRPTAVCVRWMDRDGAIQTECVEDIEGIERYGYHPLSTVAYGCSSRAQALRYGRWTLQQQRITS